MSDWLFLSYNNPQEAKSGQTRKKIRAHVTSRQHSRKNRQSADERPSTSDSKHPVDLDKHSASSEGPRSSLPKAVLREPTLATRSKRPLLRSERGIPADQVSCWNPQDDDDITGPAPLVELRGEDDIVAAEKYPSPVSIDLNVTPVPKKDWYEWLHDYWFNSTLPKAKGRLKVDTDQLDRYISWTRRLQITEPAMYYMSLLLATGIPVANGQFPLVKALWLRDRTIAALREALADPERATSDAMIQTVGYVALHEHIYGDRAATHRHHRPAQQRMIEMRGGIDKLGVPLEVKQIMVWYDRLMAAEAGNEPYFADLVDGEHIKSYNNAEAISVTNNASPSRYRHPGYGTDFELPHS